MTRLLAILVGGLCTTSLLGASPDPKDLVIPQEELSKARELVRKLGSELYREREDAHTELTKMGRKARPALLEAVGSDPDPEVRFRASRLLPKAGADDLKARLDTFLADTDSKYEHDLPGLKHFRKAVGSDEKARALFVELIKSPYNLEMFQAIERGPTEGGRAIADRRAALYGQLQHRNVGGRIVQPEQLTLPEIASLLFAESLVPSKDIPRSGMWAYVTGITFLHQNASQQAMANGSGLPHAAAYRRLLGSWLETRDDLQDLNQLPYIAQQLRELPQSLPVLRRIVTTDGVQGYAKGQALMFLVQEKKEEELPFLKKLLVDDTLVTQVWLNNGVVRGGGIPAPGQPQQPQSLLVRDVALAYLIRLTGQKLKDYGFSFPQNFDPDSQPGQQLGYGNYAFASDEARAAAMVKFGFWQLKQQLRDPNAKPPEPKKDAGPQPGNSKPAPSTGGPVAPPPPPKQ